MDFEDVEIGSSYKCIQGLFFQETVIVTDRRVEKESVYLPNGGCKIKKKRWFLIRNEEKETEWVRASQLEKISEKMLMDIILLNNEESKEVYGTIEQEEVKELVEHFGLVKESEDRYSKGDILLLVVESGEFRKAENTSIEQVVVEYEED